MHPATQAILGFFAYEHLPPHLAEVSKPFHDLAHQAAEMETEHGAELTAGLRKLLEAKDCIVRAALPGPAFSLTAAELRREVYGEDPPEPASGE